ncbi:hypothetical protein [Paenibacillus alkalitolerans]|uniref:hypothetical protein n=1 Tax=Paenibacillus alkalitolerans TaxID=2799335 RepID=UPI0018F5B3F8|nr:hypothetical protein [Paenibacillus alkalitolerans]
MALESAAKALLGIIEFCGVLPVTLGDAYPAVKAVNKPPKPESAIDRNPQGGI